MFTHSAIRARIAEARTITVARLISPPRSADMSFHVKVRLSPGGSVYLFRPGQAVKHRRRRGRAVSPAAGLPAEAKIPQMLPYTEPPRGSEVPRPVKRWSTPG